MLFKQYAKQSLFCLSCFAIFVIVLSTKRNIAFAFSTLAMLMLLVHGMFPHHHHDSEAEVCNLESHLTTQFQETNSHFTILYGETNCCENHQENSVQAHICNFNVAASKQVSVELIAVIQSFTFQYRTTKSEHRFLPAPDLFIPPVFSEVRSLRAPPLT